MKQLTTGLMILLAVFFYDCKKEKVNPTLIVKINNSQAYSNATVYLKSGGAHNPMIPLSQYDQQLAADENGSAVFADLEQGDYFVYVTATKSGTATAVGQATLSMVQKPIPNRYEKTIFLY